MSTRCVTIKIIQSQDRVPALALAPRFPPPRFTTCLCVFVLVVVASECALHSLHQRFLFAKPRSFPVWCFPPFFGLRFRPPFCHAVCFGVMSRLGKAQRNQRSRCCQPCASPVRVPASSCILPFRRPFVIIFVLSHALPAFGSALSEHFRQI
jgi:hypothetical protein